MIVPFWPWNLSDTTHVRSHTKFQLIWAINTAFTRGGLNQPPPHSNVKLGPPHYQGFTKFHNRIIIMDSLFRKGRDINDNEGTNHCQGLPMILLLEVAAAVLTPKWFTASLLSSKYIKLDFCHILFTVNASISLFPCLFTYCTLCDLAEVTSVAS